MMRRKASLALCFDLSSSCCCSTVATLLFMVKLQILQALCQGQFLLDGHAQQRVQGLLLILCSSQLPLHVIQLGHVLVTPETKRGQRPRVTGEHFRQGAQFRLEALLLFHVFSFSQTVFQMGGCLCLAHTTITSDISRHALRLFRGKMHSEHQYFDYLFFRQFLFQSNRCHGGNKPVIMHNYTLLQTWLEGKRM